MGKIIPLDFDSPTDYQRWQQYIYARPDTHCTDLAQWRLLFHELYGFRSYSFAYVERERMLGAVSVYLIRSPFFGKLLVSSPFFGYGGLYAQTPTIRARLLKQIETTARELGVDFIEFRLRQQLPAPYTVNTGFLEFDLALKPKIEDVWHSQLSSNARQNVRKSQRYPLHFSPSTDPGPTYRLLSRTLRDLGTPFHSEDFLTRIQKYFSQQVAFSEVRLDGRLVASGMMLRFRDTLLTPYIGSLKTARSTRANYCQYWGILQYCLHTGMQRFELGRSPRHSSHAQFKQKWGAQPVPVYYNYYQINPKKTYKSAAAPPAHYVFATEIWKRLPVSMTQRLGHRFFRYIP